MINYHYLTATELINYLDITSNDPVVRRLLSLLQNETIKTELIGVGMDPVDCEFKEDWEYYSPGAYIEHLRNEVDYYQRESDEWETRCGELEIECNKLKARSVAQLLEEMERSVKHAKSEAYEANRSRERIEQENKDLRDKINVWKVIES